MIHSTACETWQVHLRRCYVELERFTSLSAFVDDVLHSWEQELLLHDPEFEEDFHRLLADVEEAQAEESAA